MNICPISKQDLFFAAFAGRFRAMTEKEEEKFSIEYTGYIMKDGGIEVICEHNPAGLDFTVKDEKGNRWVAHSYSTEFKAVVK